ncbi:MAG: SDR family oxidoreductase, partial [Myxococcales bacterium]|nr:SDR family oxidoreductase [Myxococcales bacterium]
AVDLDELDDVRRVLESLLRETPAHIVVHNTGGPKGGALVHAELAELQAALARHLFSAHTILRAVLPSMRDAGYGRWINVLSTSVREPIPNLGVSNIARAAMASWTKTLAGELPPGVTINSVLPGFTDTDRLRELAAARAAQSGATVEDVRAQWVAQVPEGRLARPEETAEAIAFLAAPAAAYIRGH